jgi:hypothetical protein
MGNEIRLTERQLVSLINTIVEEVRLEEGLFGPSSSEREKMKTELIRKIDDLLEEYNLTDDDLYNSINSVINKASENNYDGEVNVRQSRTGNIVLVFTPNPTRLQKSGFYKNVVRPLVGGMKGGHTFGSGE